MSGSWRMHPTGESLISDATLVPIEEKWEIKPLAKWVNSLATRDYYYRLARSSINVGELIPRIPKQLGFAVRIPQLSVSVQSSIWAIPSAPRASTPTTTSTVNSIRLRTGLCLSLPYFVGGKLEVVRPDTIWSRPLAFRDHLHDLANLFGARTSL